MWIKRIDFTSKRFKLELGEGESIIFASPEDILKYWKTKYKYPGYVDKKENPYPFKKGDIVTIPKGTYIRTTGGRPNGPAGKTYKVKVDHFISGTQFEDSYGYCIENPEMRWAGTGGYWHGVDINDILEANGVK